MSKLPQITAFFWIMKICATTLGETAGDQLSHTMNLGYAVSSMILSSSTFDSISLYSIHNYQGAQINGTW
jgi:uncharacterized membrane-anchored protein